MSTPLRGDTKIRSVSCSKVRNEINGKCFREWRLKYGMRFLAVMPKFRPGSIVYIKLALALLRGDAIPKVRYSKDRWSINTRSRSRVVTGKNRGQKRWDPVWGIELKLGRINYLGGPTNLSFISAAPQGSSGDGVKYTVFDDVWKLELDRWREAYWQGSVCAHSWEFFSVIT